MNKPNLSAAKGPLQIGLGRILERPVVMSEQTVSANVWVQQTDGSRLWSMEFTSAGALGIRLHLEEVLIHPAAQLVLYDPLDRSRPSITISGADLAGARDCWTDTVFSERVVLECHVPAGIAVAQANFKVAELSHLYRLPFSPTMRKEGSCHNDVACFPDWAQAASSVARMTYMAGRNTYLCTGCLLASTSNSNDYFLTARHCITSQKMASTIELYWLYDTGNCNDPPPDLANVPHTTGGALILAMGVPSDFCFMRLRSPAPPGVVPANWTTQLPSPGDGAASIHHPDGTFKRISFGNLVGSDGNFWHVQWSSGATESGSSGAPLFNANYQFIGQLNGGFDGSGSSCDNPSAPDQFGRFDVTYTKIQRWLGGSGGLGSGTVPRGTYNGLFYDTDAGVHSWNSGFFTITTTAKGIFSGKLLSGGSQYPLHGQFDGDNHAQVVLTRAKQPAWTIQLQVAPDDLNVMTGSVSDGNWTVPLAGHLSSFGGKTNVPQQGRYTVVIPGNPGSPATPGGDSFGTVNVDRRGQVHLLASLADGTKITQVTGISLDGHWAFYASPRGSQSILLSRITFNDTETSDLAGDLTWLKTAAGTNTTLYPDGFEMNGSIFGTRYTPPARGNPVLNFAVGTVSFSGGGLIEPFSDDIQLKKNNRAKATGGNRLSLAFSPAKGTFTGRVFDPNAGRTIPFNGVVLQKQNRGSGFFLGADQSGQVLVQP